MELKRRSRRNHWIYPVFIILGVSILIYGIVYAVDHLVSDPKGGGYFNFSDDRITDAVGGLSGLFAAILGIIITVVSIIVQLTAERFTHVTQMFLRDRTNLGVLFFYVFCCICGVLNSFSIHQNWVPRLALSFIIGLAIIAFAVMAPYFAYVFDFLQPENIIGRIRSEALASAKTGSTASAEHVSARMQAQTLHSMEELTDITINSISGKDKLIAIEAVDALKDFAVEYLDEKKNAKPNWFLVGAGIRKNPDFVSMAETSVNEMEKRKTWVEWKALRQCQAVFHEALVNMRDVAQVCAIDTRYIGEKGIQVGDPEAVSVVVKFFNSFIRAALNSRDVRTAYNVLNQYRQLTESLLRGGWHDRAADIADHIKYYAHTSFGMQLPFVTVTCAYDLCTLCELAHELGSPALTRMIETFLLVDQPSSEDEAEETGLRGVRTAQIKLATYFLVKKAEPLARRIFEDMQDERPERLKSIKDELMRVASEDFWEVIDRGTNFEYLTPERKKALNVFFSWFPRYTADIQAQKVQV